MDSDLFCKYFLQKYPGYFVSPLRLSGSAVESLFSQFQYNTKGKLDAANYITASACTLIKQVRASHQRGKSYRDKEISIPLPKEIWLSAWAMNK